MTSHLLKSIGAVLIFICVAVTCTFAQAAATPAAAEADALYQSKKWTEAAAAYGAITRADPQNGRAWYRLGVSLHQSGQYEPAVAAYKQAVDRMPPQGKQFAMYNLAGAYARLKNRELAIEWLDKMSAGGFPAALAGQFKTDQDFAELYGDARFKELLVAADKVSRPCMYAPQARELDFWVGEWDVMLGGAKVGTNSVQRVEDGCVIMENWSSTTGQTGRSMNFYNPTTGKWRQTYVGNALGIWEMAGEYKDAAMRYEGELYSGTGKVLTRMTFFNLGPDKVRQLGENSTDEGKTWTSTWDAMYTRKR